MGKVIVPDTNTGSVDFDSYMKQYLTDGNNLPVNEYEVLPVTKTSGLNTREDIGFDYEEYKDYLEVGDLSRGVTEQELQNRKADSFNPLVQLIEGNIPRAIGTASDLYWKNLVRWGSGVGIKLAEGATSLAGVIPMVGDLAQGKGFDESMKWLYDNKVQRALTSIDNGIKELTPIYKHQFGEDVTLLDKMGTADFWLNTPAFITTDLSDGLQYVASAMVPGAMFGKVAGSGKIANGLAKAGSLGRGASKVVKWIGSTRPGLTTYQTLTEAAMEAKGLYNENKQTLAFKNYNKTYDQLSEEEQGTIDAMSANAAANTFKANAALLFVNNALENIMVFNPGIFNSIKANKLAQTGELFSKNNKHLFSKPMQVGKNFLINGFREGIIEEGMQTAITGYYGKLAEENRDTNMGEDVSGILKEWANGFGTEEGISSMVIGALIGGISGVPSGITQAKENKEIADSAVNRWENLKKSSIEGMKKADEIYSKMNNIVSNPNLSSKDKETHLANLKEELFNIEVKPFFSADMTPDGAVTMDNIGELVKRYENISKFNNTDKIADTKLKPRIKELSNQILELQAVAEKEGRELGAEEKAQVDNLNKEIKKLSNDIKVIGNKTEAELNGFSRGKGDDAYIKDAEDKIEVLGQLQKDFVNYVGKYNTKADFELDTPGKLLEFRTKQLTNSKLADKNNTEINDIIDEYYKDIKEDELSEKEFKNIKVNAEIVKLGLEANILNNELKDADKNDFTYGKLLEHAKRVNKQYEAALEAEELSKKDIVELSDNTLISKIKDNIISKVKADNEVIKNSEYLNVYDSAKGINSLRLQEALSSESFVQREREKEFYNKYPENSTVRDIESNKVYQIRTLDGKRKLFESEDGEVFMKDTGEEINTDNYTKFEILEPGETQSNKEVLSKEDIDKHNKEIDKLKKDKDIAGIKDYYTNNIKDKYTNPELIKENAIKAYNEITDSNITSTDEMRYLDAFMKSKKSGKSFVVRKDNKSGKYYIKDRSKYKNFKDAKNLGETKGYTKQEIMDKFEFISFRKDEAINALTEELQSVNLDNLIRQKELLIVKNSNFINKQQKELEDIQNKIKELNSKLFNKNGEVKASFKEKGIKETLNEISKLQKLSEDINDNIRYSIETEQRLKNHINFLTKRKDYITATGADISELSIMIDDFKESYNTNKTILKSLVNAATILQKLIKKLTNTLFPDLKLPSNLNKFISEYRKDISTYLNKQLVDEVKNIGLNEVFNKTPDSLRLKNKEKYDNTDAVNKAIDNLKNQLKDEDLKRDNITNQLLTLQNEFSKIDDVKKELYELETIIYNLEEEKEAYEVLKSQYNQHDQTSPTANKSTSSKSPIEINDNEGGTPVEEVTDEMYPNSAKRLLKNLFRGLAGRQTTDNINELVSNPTQRKAYTLNLDFESGDYSIKIVKASEFDSYNNGKEQQRFEYDKSKSNYQGEYNDLYYAILVDSEGRYLDSNGNVLENQDIAIQAQKDLINRDIVYTTLPLAKEVVDYGDKKNTKYYKPSTEYGWKKLYPHLKGDNVVAQAEELFKEKLKEEIDTYKRIRNNISSKISKGEDVIIPLTGRGSGVARRNSEFEAINKRLKLSENVTVKTAIEPSLEFEGNSIDVTPGLTYVYDNGQLIPVQTRNLDNSEINTISNLFKLYASRLNVTEDNKVDHDNIDINLKDSNGELITFIDDKGNKQPLTIFKAISDLVYWSGNNLREENGKVTEVNKNNSTKFNFVKSNIVGGVIRVGELKTELERKIGGLPLLNNEQDGINPELEERLKEFLATRRFNVNARKINKFPNESFTKVEVDANGVAKSKVYDNYQKYLLDNVLETNVVKEEEVSVTNYDVAADNKIPSSPKEVLPSFVNKYWIVDYKGLDSNEEVGKKPKGTVLSKDVQDDLLASIEKENTPSKIKDLLGSTKPEVKTEELSAIDKLIGLKGNNDPLGLNKDTEEALSADKSDEANTEEVADKIVKEDNKKEEEVINKTEKKLSAAERRELRKEKLDKAKNSGNIDNIYRIITGKPYTKADIEAEKKWFEETIGTKIPYKVVKDAIEGKAFGQLYNSVVYIWENAEVGTTYHEAFHVVSQLFLSNKQRNKVYDEWIANNKELPYNKVEEELAEEYRDFTLEEGKTKYRKNPYKWKFFRAIWNFGQWLQGKSLNEVEKLFNKIDSGYYKNRNFKPLSGKYSRIVVDSEAFTNDVLNSMNYYFFNELDKNFGGVDNLISGDVKATTLYNNIEDIFNNKLDELYEELELAEEDNDLESIELVEKDVTNFEKISDNFKAFAKEHTNRLKQYQIEVNLSGIDEDSVYKSTEANEEERTGDAGWGGSDNVNTSVKQNASKIVKLRFAQLAKVKKGKDGKNELVLNSLGLPQSVNFGENFSLLVNELSGYTTLGQMASKLDALSKDKDYLHLAKLYKDFALDKLNDLEFIANNPKKFEGWTQFEQTFFKANNEFNFDYFGKDIFKVINSNEETLTSRVLSDWKGLAAKAASNTYSKFYNKDYSYNIEAFKNRFDFDNSGAYKTKKELKEALLDFYNVLGIQFKSPEKIIGKDIDKLSEIRKYFWKDILAGKQEYLFSTDESNNQYERMRELVDIQKRTSPSVYESSHINSEGKSIYNNTLFSFVTQIFNTLEQADTLEEVIEQLPYLGKVTDGRVEITDTYARNSTFLKYGGLIFDENGKKHKKFESSIGEGIQEVESGVYTDYSKLSEADKLASTINRIVNGGYFSLLRTADKKLERFIRVESNNSNVNDTYRGYIADEIEAIRELIIEPSDYLWSNATINIKKGEVKTPDGIFLSFMREYTNKEGQKQFKFIHDIIMKNITKPNFKVTEKGIQVGNKVIVKSQELSYVGRALLKDTQNKVFDKLVSSGVLVKKGDVYNNNGLTGIKEQDTEQNIKDLLWDSIISSVSNNIEQTKLIFGNPAFYKSIDDFFKRSGSAPGTKKTSRIDNYINKGLELLGKRTDRAENLKDGLYNKPIIKTSIIGDILVGSRQAKSYERFLKGLDKEIGKAYGKNKIDEADGHSYASLDYVRELYIRVGDWTWGKNSLEDSYQYIMQDYYANNKDLSNDDFNEIFGYNKEDYAVPKIKEGEVWREISKPKKNVFNNVKPQYFGPLANVKGFIPTLYKTQFHIIHPGLIKGKPNMKKMMDYMRNNQVSIVSHYSANKGVTTKIDKNLMQPTPLYNTRGEFALKDNAITQDIYHEYMGVQLDVGFKSKDKVITGTQMMKQVINGLFSAGKAMSIEMKDRVTNYLDLNTKRIELAQEILLDDLGVTLENGKYKVADYNIFRDKLKSELLSRDMPTNMVDAINLLDETTSIDVLINRTKFESILFALADSKVVKQKRFGKASYQTASTLYESDVTRDYNDGFLSSKNLNFYVLEDENGNLLLNDKGNQIVKSMEVYLPSWFEDFVDLDNVDESLKRIIGFRIPTQGLNSIDSIVVKGFLPKEAGDMIVLPSEITKKAGSDYDIDKMNLYIPNYYLDVNNKPVFINQNTPYEVYRRDGIEKINKYYKSEIFSKLKEHPFLKETFNNIFYSNTLNILRDYSLQDIEDILIDELNKYNKNTFEGQVANRVIDIINTASETRDNRIEEGYKLLSPKRYKLLQTENGITELQHEIMLDPNNFKQLVRSIDSDLLTKLADEISILKTGKERGKSDLYNMVQMNHLVDVYKQFMEGKAAVGVTALASTFNIMAQLYDLRVNSKYSEWNQKDFKLEYKDTKINLPHNLIDDTISLGKLKDFNDEQDIPFVLSLWINAAVDNAKDPYMFGMNVTMQNLSTVLYLTMAGVPTNTIMYFMNQPIIVDYMKNQAKYESTVAEVSNTKLFKDQIIELTRKKYKGKESKKTNFTNKELTSMIENGRDGKLSTEEQGQQLQILEDFLRYQGTSTHVRKAVQAVEYDTGGFGKNLAETLLKLDARDKAVNTDNVIYNLDKVFNGNKDLKGFIGPYYQAVKSSLAYYEELFTQLKNKNVGDIFDFVKSIYNHDSTRIGVTKKAKALNKFMPDFITWLVLDTPVKNSKGEFVSINQEADYLFKEVSKQVLEIKDAKPGSPLYNKLGENKLIKALYPMTNYKTGEGFIKMFSRKLDSLESNELTEAWNELIASGSLEEDLVKFLFKQSGLQNSPMNFMDLVPYTIYGELIKKGLSTEIGKDKDKLFNFTLNWFLNNYNDNDIIPKGISGVSQKGSYYQFASNPVFPFYKLTQTQEKYQKLSKSEKDKLLKSGINIYETNIYFSNNLQDGSKYGKLVSLTDIPGFKMSNFEKNYRDGISKVGLGTVDFASYFKSIGQNLIHQDLLRVNKEENINKAVEEKKELDKSQQSTAKKGFKLSIDKKGKDQGKANYANAFISYPNKGTSSYQYALDARKAGIPINTEISINENTVAFVSVNGNNKATDEQIEKTYLLAREVIEEGGTIIMDSTYDANRSWNKSGEALVQEQLGTPTGQTKEGYNYWKQTTSETKTPISQEELDKINKTIQESGFKGEYTIEKFNNLPKEKQDKILECYG